MHSIIIIMSNINETALFRLGEGYVSLFTAYVCYCEA